MTQTMERRVTQGINRNKKGKNEIKERQDNVRGKNRWERLNKDKERGGGKRKREEKKNKCRKKGPSFTVLFTSSTLCIEGIR
jgi:hypothetical protein